MNKNPLISVLLPLYNEPISLAKQAIDSILNQTFSHLEVILLLDNPQNTELINLIILNTATIFKQNMASELLIILHLTGVQKVVNMGRRGRKRGFFVIINMKIMR